MNEIPLQLNWTINCWLQCYLIFHFFQSYFLFMNTNVTSGLFSSKDVDFTSCFPGIVKKHAARRRTFSVASHLKTRIHIILHCKTFIQLHTWQFLLQVRVVLELRLTVASLTTSLLPDWITITASSPQWGGLLFLKAQLHRTIIDPEPFPRDC